MEKNQGYWLINTVILSGQNDAAEVKQINLIRFGGIILIYFVISIVWYEVLVTSCWGNGV